MASLPDAITPARRRRAATPPAAGRHPLDRDAALRQVRDARRRLQSRAERFAHLKRVYD